MRARSFRASRSFSLAIQAMAACWPSALASRVSMILANWSGDRFSRLRSSRCLMPYSGSPERAAAAVFLPDRAAAHVPEGLHRELDDVEQVHGNGRVREHPAHRRQVDGAHVDGDDLHGVPPGRRGAGQPVRGVISGAALGLAEHALVPGQVVKAGVPPVRELHVLPAVRVLPPPGPAAPVLVDAQVRDRGMRRVQDPVRLARERVMDGRPGDPGVPARLARGDPPLRDLGPGMLQQPPGDLAPRRHLRHPLGEPRPRAAARRALHPALDQEEVHILPAGPDIPRPGHHVLVHLLRRRPAPRAYRRAASPRPHRQLPARLPLNLGHHHAVYPEQRRRHILGRRGPIILDRHKSGSSGPRAANLRTDTHPGATARSRSAG